MAQMVRTISRVDKLHSIGRIFENRGMMEGSLSTFTAAVAAGYPPPIRPLGAEHCNPESDFSDSEPNDGDDDDGGPSSSPYALAQVMLASKPGQYICHQVHVFLTDTLILALQYPKSLDALAAYIKQPGFSMVLRRFIFTQRHPEYKGYPHVLPEFSSKISVFHSAVASFYAPSNHSGASGMYRERIRANPNYGGNPRFDTVFVSVADADSPDLEGEYAMGGLLVARVLLFFSFYDPVLQKYIPCALINWFVPKSDKPDPNTGMWVFEPEIEGGRPSLEVIHLDTILRGAHLLPKYGSGFLPENFSYIDALDAFKAYFVNHFIDYPAHELITGHQKFEID
jgi:hypothetical protein